MAALFAAPFGYLVVRNAAGGLDVLATLAEERALAPLARSVALAGAVAAAATAVGTGAAWLVTRTDVPAARLWQALLPLPLVVPSFIGAFALLAAFAPGGLVEGLLGVRAPQLAGFPGAFLVLTLLTYPYVYLPAAARLRQLPRSLEESARLLGVGPLGTFRSVVLPQARGAVLAGTLLVFLYAVSDFGAVQLLRYDSLTRVIYATRLLDPGVSLVLSLELGALAAVVVVLERVAVGRGGYATAGVAGEPLRHGLGRWKAGATGILAALVALALVAPVAVLAYWAVRGVAAGSTRASSLVADAGGLAGPAANTALVSVAAAALAVCLVAPVAYLTVRHRSAVGAAANALVVAGFALPGLVIALALVFWTVGAPGPVAALYASLPLLLLAYVLHFGAQALRTAQVAVASVPPAVDEAARSLGAGRARRLVAVELPIMAPSLLAGGGLVLLSTMKELPATLLLAPPGFQTLATKVWTAAEDAFLADASLASLLLIALSGVLTWVLVVRRAGIAR